MWRVKRTRGANRMAEAGDEVRVLGFDEVVAEERARYLDDRRRLNGLPPTGVDKELWGLSLSGGGIRSATFCLGVLQTFMARNVLGRFDYLSTVSGGGYIGSCLSSIFAGQAGRDEELGLDEAGSPFVGLRAAGDYEEPAQTKLSVRHQMHHLRSHGEYLMPRSGILHRDFQRFLGVGALGVFYTLLVFSVALVLLISGLHLLFAALDPDLETLSPPGELRLVAPACAPECHPGLLSKAASYLTGISSAWWGQRFLPPLKRMAAGASSHPVDLLGMALLGALWVSGWVVFVRRRAPRLVDPNTIPIAGVPAGWTATERAHSQLCVKYNWSSLAVVALVTLLGGACRSYSEGDYLGGFWLPFTFSCSAWLVGFLAMSIGETWRDMRNKIGAPSGHFEPIAQARRSLYDTIGGANLVGMVGSLLVPLLSVLTFSLARLPNKFFIAGILAIVGLGVTRGNKWAAIDKSRFLAPLIDLLVLLFLLLAASRVSEILLAAYRERDLITALGAASVAMAAAAAVLFLGFFLDPNRISPHHFFSDRLAEAYLRTDARVKVHGRETHMPLATVRNDEQLELRALGTPTCAPFHLIVAALNLSDSDELVRKRLKSDHFVFSGLHVGSRTTGFVRTGAYRAGHTRLATALATSAAAVASAAGLNTRRSVAFLATLFNGRLGLWVENPGRYGDGRNPTRALTFWPWRLLQEILGAVKGDTRLINVSDGGHTGDNLGLMPLLQRRCEVIVACDAEADANLDFDSLRNVVRMANVELNVAIEIDLAPVQRRRMSKSGFRTSEASVLEGTVYYPRMGELEPSRGRLIYIKSSLSRAATISRVGGVPAGEGGTAPTVESRAAQPPPERTIPASVASYARECASFPHQTTVDQFFDDAQFEAYRALGAFLGELAAREVKVGS